MLSGPREQIVTPSEHLAELERTSPILAAKLRKLPPQQLQELLQTKDGK